MYLSRRSVSAGKQSTQRLVILSFLIVNFSKQSMGRVLFWIDGYGLLYDAKCFLKILLINHGIDCFALQSHKFVARLEAVNAMVDEQDLEKALGIIQKAIAIN